MASLEETSTSAGTRVGQTGVSKALHMAQTHLGQDYLRYKCSEAVNKNWNRNLQNKNSHW